MRDVSALSRGVDWPWYWRLYQLLRAPQGDPVILFLGVALIVVAIVLNGIASGKVSKGTAEGQTKKRESSWLFVPDS